MHPRSPNWFDTPEVTGTPCHRAFPMSLPAPASRPQLAHTRCDAPESLSETACGTVLFLERSRPVRDHVTRFGTLRRTPLAVWCRASVTAFEAASQTVGERPGDV
jgi:hypothetical protein